MRRKYADEKLWDMKCRHYIEGVTAMVFDLITERAPQT